MKIKKKCHLFKISQLTCLQLLWAFLSHSVDNEDTTSFYGDIVSTIRPAHTWLLPVGILKLDCFHADLWTSSPAPPERGTILTCSRTLAVSRGKVTRSATQPAIPADRIWTATLASESVVFAAPMITDWPPRIRSVNRPGRQQAGRQAVRRAALRRGAAYSEWEYLFNQIVSWHRSDIIENFR